MPSSAPSMPPSTTHEATARVENTDRERNRFITDHFQIDPLDPAHYDLILNAATFSCAECADLVIAALERLRKHAGSSRGAQTIA